MENSSHRYSNVKIGLWIRAMRLKSRRPFDLLGAARAIQVSEKELADFEDGVRGISCSQLAALAEFYEVRASDLDELLSFELRYR